MNNDVKSPRFTKVLLFGLLIAAFSATTGCQMGAYNHKPYTHESGNRWSYCALGGPHSMEDHWASYRLSLSRHEIIPEMVEAEKEIFRKKLARTKVVVCPDSPRKRPNDPRSRAVSWRGCAPSCEHTFEELWEADRLWHSQRGVVHQTPIDVRIVN